MLPGNLAPEGRHATFCACDALLGQFQPTGSRCTALEYVKLVEDLAVGSPDSALFAAQFQTALAHKMAAASTALSGLQQMRPPWLHKPGPGPISLGRASPPQAPKLAHVSNFDRGLNWALRAVSQSTGQNISRPLTVDFNGNWVKVASAARSLHHPSSYPSYLPAALPSRSFRFSQCTLTEGP